MKKYRDWIFIAMIISLPFYVLPWKFPVGFLGGPLGGKMVIYPLLAGFAFTAWWHCRGGIPFDEWGRFRKYILIYFGVLLASLLVGLYSYPYYDVLLHSAVPQIEKLPKVLEFLRAHGMDPSEEVLFAGWFVVREVKGLLLGVLYTFGFSYMLLGWYHDDADRMLSMVGKGVLVSFGLVFAYCMLEIPYLAGNAGAKHWLGIITPYIHAVQPDGFWWPPLFWKDQMRSLFAEPSGLGMWSAFALPWLSYLLCKEKHWPKKAFYAGCVLCLITFIVLARSRLAFGLLLANMTVLVLGLLLLQWKSQLKNVFLLLCCFCVAFGGANLFVSNYLKTELRPVRIVAADNKPAKAEPNKSAKTNPNKPAKEGPNKSAKSVPNKKAEAGGKAVSYDLKRYVDENLNSLLDPKRGSNGARFSVILTDMKIGMEHPLLGVGSGLRNAYIPDNLPELAKGNGEIRMWLKNWKEKGFLRFGIIGTEFFTRFAETGILGVVLYFFPALFLFKRLVGMLWRDRTRIEPLFILSAFLAIFLQGFGAMYTNNFCYWVMLGVGYAYWYGQRERS